MATVKLPHDVIPFAAQICERRQESPDVFSIALQALDPMIDAQYRFLPGQFNMLYVFGVGEVAISIVSDHEDQTPLTHTIRRVGRVTNTLFKKQAGDVIGVRGPFGVGWPIAALPGRDIIIVTGGLGCAPSVSIINYIMKRRQQFGRVVILQGVKHSDDLIYQQQYAAWAAIDNTEVYLAADVSAPNWPGHTGLVTELLRKLEIDQHNTICMMCGPEGMMLATVKELGKKGLDEQHIYLSLERNMECAIGHCGHCQLGGQFICKDGPVFAYPDIKTFLGLRGF